MDISNPKVFISYSWTSADRVLSLAQRLMGDGVEVVLDKWDLKEGQDKYAFMERFVTDSTIDKVLMICDNTYAEKANNREGGVGDETMVISPEVYSKANETKYIPIIFERDENGKEYTPAYLKSRIYIDLTETDDYEKNYERLLRSLHNKPENSKPVLGKMPEWLNDESTDFSGVRNLLKQVQSYDGKNNNKIVFVTRKFSDEFIKTLLSLAPTQDQDFDENLLIQINVSKPLRDLYFDYIESLIASDLDVGVIIGDFFEQIYNGTYHIEGKTSYSDCEFEFPRFVIWEMFIGTTAIFLHYEKYLFLNNLLQRTYFLWENALGNSLTPDTFTRFRPTHRYIDDHIKPKSETPNLFTLAGDMAVKREKIPLITQITLSNADLVLYQLSSVFDFPSQIHWRWFPILYVYWGEYCKQPLWSKLVSNNYCQKLFPLFGVDNIDQLKALVEKSKPDRDMCYSRSFYSAPSIQQSIELDNIGTMP
jgi:hypothetical protein